MVVQAKQPGKLLWRTAKMRCTSLQKVAKKTAVIARKTRRPNTTMPPWQLIFLLYKEV